MESVPITQPTVLQKLCNHNCKKMCIRDSPIPYQYLHFYRAIRLRIRFHSLYALSYLFCGRRTSTGTLCPLYRIYGIRHDDSRNGRRLASGPDGLQPFLYLVYAMLRCNLWGDGTVKD